MAAIGTIQYRLAGNIFENRFYLSGATPADAATQLVAIWTALREIQTADVEYLQLLVTNTASPYETEIVDIGEALVHGARTGGQTAPSITFLQFGFRSESGRGKVIHRVRGFEINSTTDLGSFNVLTSGASDPDASITNVANSSNLANFVDAVATNSVDGRGNSLSGSTRVDIGAKRAVRSL